MKASMDINKLMTLDDGPEFDEMLSKIASVAELNQNYKDDIVKAMHEGIAQCGEQVEKIRQAIETKRTLKEISDIVSLSYIAKNYFNKSKEWFYQRMNGNKVNGKASMFTKDELKTLNFALKDIGKKIASLSVSNG